MITPLTDLTKTKNGKTERRQNNTQRKIEWDQHCEQAVQAIKQVFQSEPILQLPDLAKTFTLATDASSTGIGACLLQEHEGNLHPVCYISRKLTDTEQRYAVVERECLAIVWATAKLARYLLGKPFILQTDHAPLKALNGRKLNNGRMARWALKLSDFQYDVKHVAGVDNVIADTLSRLENSETL